MLRISRKELIKQKISIGPGFILFVPLPPVTHSFIGWLIYLQHQCWPGQVYSPWQLTIFKAYLKGDEPE